MEHLLNPRVKNIEISGIRQFSNLVSQVPGAISLTLGQPDFPTPEHIKEAAVRAIADNRTGYTANAGLEELRKAACNYVASRYDLHYQSNEVIVTIGASEAIDIAFRSVLTEGSEVILPGPVYPGYEPAARLCGAKVLFADTTKTGFRLTANVLKHYLSPKTRCVVLPYPSNPTGAVLSESELAELADLLSGLDVLVISDEIYSELTFTERHHSIAAQPGMRERTVVINGLSKSHAMTGWRIGLLFAPEPLARHMLKVHQYNVSCASSISQHAAIAALTEGQDDALPMREEYRWRRDYAVDRLRQMGLPVEPPEGAFYVFPSVREFGMSSWTFAERLLREHGVAVVPGSAFSRLGEGYVRISYACGRSQLAAGLDRLEAFVNSLRRS
ncbi:aminotransferase A [Alicyclobacillus contaminans]|uniref:aminotransferase A n=1 Tax=Alicyclobacillus contaminans TaxID=392016 RepID=UPI00047AB5CF|nr:aminotransferase A [Alicyclobacillus contaminans]